MEDNTITPKEITMFKINNHIEYIADAHRKDLLECYYSQLNGMLDLARSLDIISLEEYTSIINQVHNMMANKIVKEGWS